MRAPSNLPPGVTDRDIEEQAGAFDDLQGDDIDQDTGEILNPAPDGQLWRETCTRCRGSGTYGGLYGGDTCFSCGGTGVRTFKTSPEQRARRAKPTPESRQAYREKQERAGDRNLQRFATAYQDVHDWLQAASARGFNVAAGMLQTIRSKGSLPEGSMAAARRFMEADRVREQQRAEQRQIEQQRAAPVNEVNLQAVEQAFARAKQQGIKWPALTLDGFRLKPAGENSRNAGSIYVTKGSGQDAPYLGKVLRGQFMPSHLCDDDIKARVIEAMADPLASAVAYGKKFGRCAVCMRELSDEESVARGIGPICYDRMFGG